MIQTKKKTEKNSTEASLKNIQDIGRRMIQLMGLAMLLASFSHVQAQQTTGSVVGLSLIHIFAPARVKEDLEGLRREMQQTLSNEVATHTVSIQMGRDGLVISLREAGFFPSGSATPRAETMPTLRRLATSLGRSQYDLRIEGHTDNVPIHNAEFDSNWELSSARATRIARIFLDMKAMPCLLYTSRCV